MVGIFKTDNTFEILNLVQKGGYGEMYIHDNAIAQTLTLQNTFYKITDTWVSGENSGFVADTSNSQLICNRSGRYRLSCQLNYNGSNNDAYEFSIFVNGVEEPSLVVHTDARQISQTISSPIMGLLILSKNDTIDLRGRCTSSAGTQITVVHVNISLSFITGV